MLEYKLSIDLYSNIQVYKISIGLNDINLRGYI